MVRATVYVTASALIWFAEGYVFSRFLGFSGWQTALLGLFYIGAFAVSLVALRRYTRGPRERSENLAGWRLLSLAPMVTTIVGSFLSLPVILIVLALGKVA